MGKNKEIQIDKVRVEVHDGPMLLPEGLSDAQAIKVLERKIDYEQQLFGVHAEFDGFIWESAYALSKVLEAQFGWAGARSKRTFFGDIPPRMIGIKVDVNETVQVPWGEFRVPGITGYLESTQMQKPDGRHVFVLAGEVLRKNEDKVNQIIAGMREYVRTNSIYKGKAFHLDIYDDMGQYYEFPEINFIRLDPAQETELVLPTTTARMVRVHVFTPIERTEEVRAASIPLKRGVLLAGLYGTGKTMILHVAAIKARRNGWTFIQCKAAQLPAIIKVARSYQPCVVACEDIDKVTGGARTEIIDMILNTIDGVEAKGTEIMVLVTTNDPDKINPSMMRPGRLDAFVTVGPPDAEAAEALARQYGRGLIHEDEPLERSPQMLAGKIPAVNREIVERSKLAAIDTTPRGGEFKITDDDLVIGTIEMEEHIRLATPKLDDTRSDREKAADRLGTHLERAAAIGEGYSVSALPEAVAAYQLSDGAIDDLETPEELVNARAHNQRK